MTWVTQETWKQYISSNTNDEIQEFVDHPEKMLLDIVVPVSLVSTVQTLNNKVQKTLDAYNSCGRPRDPSSVVLHQMHWSWVLCYGENNYFDFDDISECICVLQGPNASGKSSFLDVICLGMFGLPTGVRTMQHPLKAKQFIKLANNDRPPNTPMTICLIFSVDNHRYEIIRSFDEKDKTARIIDHESMVEHVEGITAVDTWITDHIGSFENVQIANIVGQLHVDTDNFLYIKQEQQKAVLDKVMNLDAVNAYGKVIKEAHASHAAMLGALKTSIQAIESAIPIDDNDAYDDKIKEVINSTSKLGDIITELQLRRDSLSASIGNQDGLESCELTLLKKQLAKSIKKLDTFQDLTDEDKEKALLLKGEHYLRLAQLKEKQGIIGVPQSNTSVQDIEVEIELLKKSIDSHQEIKPLLTMSDDLLNSKQFEYNDWCKQQNPQYLKDPDILEFQLVELQDELTYVNKRLSKLMSKECMKPTIEPCLGARHDDISLEDARNNLSTFEEELSNLRTKLMKTTVPNISYTKWTTEYSAWEKQVQEVFEYDVDDTLEDLQAKYDEYLQYIDKVETKSTMYNEIQEQMTALQAELEQLGNIPYNPDCWACQLQPMKIRQEQLNCKEQALRKSLTKLTKFMTAIGDVNIKLKKQEAKCLQTLIDKRGYYNATYERMSSEKAAWETHHELKAAIVQAEQRVKEAKDIALAVTWREYNHWHGKVQRQRDTVASLEVTVSSIKNFLCNIPKYVELRETIKREVKAKYALEQWNKEHDELQSKLAEFALEIDRITLADEVDELQSIISVNIDILERLKQLEACVNEHKMIEKRIAYAEYLDISQELTKRNKEYIEQRSHLISMQRHLQETSERCEALDMYKTALAIIQKRLDMLIVLTSKFVGERNNNDGYKEYIYQTTIIPSFKQHINTFLETFTNIRIDIQYTAKGLMYELFDTQSKMSIMFDMASGYQKFIVGIAVRAALAQMSAIGHELKHMFIDEGFGSFDVVNSQKIKHILSILRSYIGYKSIILISHSTCVDVCADKIAMIDIPASASASVMRHGKEYPNIITQAPKRRGKGKKKEA